MSHSSTRSLAATTSLHPPRARRRGWRPGPTLALLLRVCRGISTGALTIVLPDGGEQRFVGSGPGPEAVLVFHRERAARRFVTGGRLGWCEAYIDGDWSSPDVATFFELILANEAVLGRLMDGRPWLRRLSWLLHRLRPNTRAGARRNIAYHYDLGNDFYAAWLDPSMTYSAALFSEGDRLEDAQRRKYEALAARLDLRPGLHVLEIGCGWGGFAIHLARQHQVRVTAITISREQYAHARRRVAIAGLEDQVEIRLQDYRDVTGSFDRIASIEMFEAVGEAHWPQFFGQLRDRLAPGGRAALQIITIADHRFEDYRSAGDYIQRYIFPGGMLPSRAVLERLARSVALDWVEDFAFGRDYALTCKLWNKRFQEAWPVLQRPGFDDRFKRMWEQYLAYCAAGFTAGTIDVLQLVLSRPVAMTDAVAVVPGRK